MKTLSRFRLVLDSLLLLVVLPLVGVVFAGRPVKQYLEFPPQTRYVEHAGFSWGIFLAMAAGVVVVILPFAFRVLSMRSVPVPKARARRFPWWGWVGVVLTLSAWTVAWTRLPVLEAVQIFTFTPIWLGYIVTVNALTWKRTGRCLLTHRTRFFLALFPLSAVFWWYFEYLNRFVQNWYYVGIGSLGPGAYFLYATLPFATVLPAVLSTKQWLSSYPRLTAGLEGFLPVRVRTPRVAALGVLVAATAGLAGISIWPDLLFPLLWLAPLFIIISLQVLHGQRTILHPVTSGNWRDIGLAALAALVCGFFWELWNMHSLAKWQYAVPYVNRFKLFEMPVLGYAGYLPFGLECLVIADFILKPPIPADHGPALEKHLRPAGAANICRMGNAVILCMLAVTVFLLPGLQLARDLSDPALREPRIPRVAWRLHRDLAPRYARWARRRVAAATAADLPLHDVPSTEWPMFGSVYFLWATENLQDAWERDPARSGAAPVVAAREAIDAAVDLVLDPVHHTWVRRHWGDDYMHDNNVFFRSLIIAALTSYENLLGEGRHLDVLRNQVETLSADLDASTFGILEDYPGECYPIDVLAAVACIRRADRVLGTDHSAFAARARRAFTGRMLDRRGLIPYLADADTGQRLGPSRGVGNSYVLIFAPELWPNLATDWYQRYEEFFWQSRWGASGFREFPRDMSGMDWLYDVDAGPVIAGFSPAANAFGVGAARVNGRFDHAWTLSSQVLAACWPLPGGGLLGPRLLSNPVHAPYLGEACVLFFLSLLPPEGTAIQQGGRAPLLVTIGFVFYLGAGVLLLGLGLLRVRTLYRGGREILVPFRNLQVVLWCSLLAGAVLLTVLGRSLLAVCLLLLMLVIPRAVRRGASELKHKETVS